MFSRLYRLTIAVFALLSFALPSFAQEGASWLRQSSNALNPKISVIADLLYQAGPGQENSLAVRETEIGIQADIDPYARADFFFALPEGEEFELEEGFVTLTALPLGLQLRGGKFLPNFGRLNMIHSHERPQVDAPAVLESFLGEEGLRSTGAEVSRVFTPLGTFAELTYAFLNDLGEETKEVETTTEIVDVNGNTVTVPVSVAGTATPDHRTIKDYAHVARLRVYRDITDAANLELGVSGAIRAPEFADRRRMGGVDLTFRWRPLREGLYRSFTWRTEALVSKRDIRETSDLLTGTVITPAFTTHRGGGYSYVEFQPARRWRAGVRGDYVEDPETTTLEVTRAAVPYVTFYTSEFNRMRVQYRYRDLPGGQHDHTGYVQWTVILGPHGAHPF